MKTKKMRSLKLGVSATIALFFGSILLLPSIALAFSGYGAGTSDNPYRIGSCSQLGEITNDLSGYYVLVSNIDCSSDNSFAPIGGGSPFTGTLDGQGHTIKDLQPSSCGLFCYLNGSTVENLNLSGGSMTVSSTSNYGSLSSVVEGSTAISNVHSSMDISIPNQQLAVGGLVGYLANNSTLTKSSYTGEIDDDYSYGYVGGLVGLIPSGSTTEVDTSYFAGTINVASSILDQLGNSVNRLLPQLTTFTLGQFGKLVNVLL